MLNNLVIMAFASPGRDYEEESIDLNKELIPHPNSTFFYSTEGSGMTESFIPNKSKLIIDRSIKPKHGDIVHCILNVEPYIRRLIKVHNGAYLTANSDIKPISINSEIECTICGVVTNIIISCKDV